MMLSLYPEVPIYIWGDANVNPNHPTRPQIFWDDILIINRVEMSLHMQSNIFVHLIVDKQGRLETGYMQFQLITMFFFIQGIDALYFRQPKHNAHETYENIL